MKSVPRAQLTPLCGGFIVLGSGGGIFFNHKRKQFLIID